MITEFDDFCLWMDVLVDELWRQLPPAYKPTSGPAPACGDSELITMAVVGECRGWVLETDLLTQWRERRHLFPVVPERSRFNRRRRNLLHALNAIRQGVLTVLDLAQDRQCASDSLPVPVLPFHLVPGAASKATWQREGAAFGKVPAQQQTIFGDTRHLLVTRNGVIRDCVLAPASESAVVVGEALLRAQKALLALGDKGYRSALLAATLPAEQGVTLLTVPRRNQREQLPASRCRLLNRWRQGIETVNDQLSEQFAIGRHHAHTFWGRCARLYTKLAAQTLCVYLNRLTGAPDCLHSKALALSTH